MGGRAQCVFGVILGTGVGAIGVERRVLEGHNAIAASGHNPLPWQRDERPGRLAIALAGCIETSFRSRAAADHARATRTADAATIVGAPMRATRRAAHARRYEAGSPRARNVINIVDRTSSCWCGLSTSRGSTNVPAVGAWVFADAWTRLVRNVHGDSTACACRVAAAVGRLFTGGCAPVRLDRWLILLAMRIARRRQRRPTALHINARPSSKRRRGWGICPGQRPPNVERFYGKRGLEAIQAKAARLAKRRPYPKSAPNVESGRRASRYILACSHAVDEVLERLT